VSHTGFEDNQILLNDKKLPFFLIHFQYSSYLLDNCRLYFIITIDRSISGMLIKVKVAVILGGNNIHYNLFN